MKKKIKKSIILLMCCLMVFSSYAAAFAQEDMPLGPMESLKYLLEIQQQKTSMRMFSARAINQEASTGNITINNVKDETTVKGYKLITVGVTGGNLTYNLNQAYSQVFNILNVSTVKDLSELPASDVIAACQQAVREGQTADISFIVSGGTAIAQDVPMGLYYIALSGTDDGTIYNPILSMVPTVTQSGGMEDTQAVAKSYAPIPEKKIADENELLDETTASIGDVVNFKVTVDVPKYTSKVDDSKVTFVLTDTMSQGLTYLGEHRVTDQDGKVLTNAFTVSTSQQTDSTRIVFTFDYAKIKNCASITLDYSAMLNEKAQLGASGNSNSVALTYTNKYSVDSNGDPDTDTKTTEPDVTKVYTFGLDLTKYELGNYSLKLEGAKFQLEDADGDAIYFIDNQGTYTAVSSKYFNITKDSGADTYTALGTKTKDDGTTEQITLTNLMDSFVTDSQGKAVIKGLKEGTYTLKEIEAPEGYFIIDSEYTFAITASTTDGTLNGFVSTGASTGNEVQNEDSFYHKSIANNTKYTLPSTGSVGTLMFMVGGAFFIALALWTLWRRNRRKES